MKLINSRILCALAGSLMVLLGTPAQADDSEVFTSAAIQADKKIKPNVLFVIDTSGSMDGEVTVYDPAFPYVGPCDKDVVYWQTASDAQPPACDTNQFITTSANRCRTGYLGMAASGWYRGRIQQLDKNGNAWQNMVAGEKDRKIECEDDWDSHGDVNANQTDGGTKKRPRNGTDTGASKRWGDKNANSQLNWTNKQRISLYSGNYANYWYGTGDKARTTRLGIVRNVAKSLIDKLNSVNLGIMRYSNNEGATTETTAEGGMVTYPISELTADNKTKMKAELDSYVAAGNTPLSETYYEAYLYLSGGAVKYGNSSKLNKDTDYHSVAASRVGNTDDAEFYDSPMDFSCQTNFIVYLTDGLPTADTSAETDIKALPDFATDGFVATKDGGGGATCAAKGPDGTNNGRCMVNLARYMNNHDLNDDIGGEQKVVTYVIGFGDDIATSKGFLDDVAEAGGGKAYTQKDAAGLTATLEEIFDEVSINTNATFVSPTVAVNAFNRTRNLNNLFVSVFSPSKNLHWAGNLKKYQLLKGEIYGDSTSLKAVGDDGFFKVGVSDMFNADKSNPDGPVTTEGGAASRMTDASKRNIYTYLGGTDKALKADANLVSTKNAAITKAKLGIPSTGDLTQVVKFINGYDVAKDVNSTTPRKAMGDPMRTRPAVAIYGGTEAKPDGVVFITTNDGYLHAFKMDTGDELWAFIPDEMLGRQYDLFINAPTSTRRYALDGDVRISVYDADGDGLIETGDHIYALFGFGRGGSVIYALDVTEKENPKFLWKKDRDQLAHLGQAWSAPVITRVNVDTNLQTDKQRIVAIFGGGYDESQENQTDNVYAKDGLGNAIYMLEASTGNLLWSAGKTSSGANFPHAEMNNAFPSEITVLDMDGDSYADRMYAADVGGRIWRFDIWHGEAPDMLVSGGVLATLGAGSKSSTPTREETRRFYYAPDVSIVTPRGSKPFMNIAIGSGFRGHPLEVTTEDRFYAVRDYQPFIRRLNSSYAAPDWKPITDDDLKDMTTDVTSQVIDEPGWKIKLNGNGWVGEKVLAESVTAGGVIFFPTFTPNGEDKENPCLPATLNRTYAVFLDNAHPFWLRDAEKPGDPPPKPAPSDRYTELSQGGIAPGLAIIKTPENQTLCLEGVEAIGRCIDIGDVVRTYWERKQ